MILKGEILRSISDSQTLVTVLNNYDLASDSHAQGQSILEVRVLPGNRDIAFLEMRSRGSAESLLRSIRDKFYGINSKCGFSRAILPFPPSNEQIVISFAKYGGGPSTRDINTLL